MSYEYSVDALVAAHTAFRELLDSESGNAKILIRSASDELLAEIVLADPCGSVDTENGRLTLDIDTQEDSAPATGTASYAEIVDGDGAVHLTMPCQQGSAAASGFCVLSSLSIIEESEVTMVSAVIG